MLYNLTDSTTVNIDRVMCIGASQGRLICRLEGISGLVIPDDKTSIMTTALKLLHAPGNQGQVFIYYRNTLLRRGGIVSAEKITNRLWFGETPAGPGIVVRLSGGPYNDVTHVDGNAIIGDDVVYYLTPAEELDATWAEFREVLSNDLEGSLECAMSQKEQDQ